MQERAPATAVWRGLDQGIVPELFRETSPDLAAAVAPARGTGRAGPVTAIVPADRATGTSPDAPERETDLAALATEIFPVGPVTAIVLAVPVKEIAPADPERVTDQADRAMETVRGAPATAIAPAVPATTIIG